MRHRMVFAALLIISIITLPVMAEFAAAELTKINYEATLYPGVLAEDRATFKNADMNAIGEDTANFVYQGQTPLTHSPSAGYIADMNVTMTNLGTLTAVYGPVKYLHANVTPRGYVISGSGYVPELKLFPPSPQPPPIDLKGIPATIEKEPIEGWFLTFNVTPPGFPSFTGVMVVTYGGFNLSAHAVVPQVIYNATNGSYFKIAGVDVYTIDNPRLTLRKYVLHLVARSLGTDDNAITLYFNFTITISFIKSTKQVLVHEYVTYKAHTYCCIRLPIEVYYGRIAVIDSNPKPTGCRSFYGWTNFTLPKCSCEQESVPVFLVLSWVNNTLDKSLRDWLGGSDNKYNVSYAVYMAAYPFNNNFTYAISSVLHDPYVSAVWRALYIHQNYANVKMSDEDGNGEPDGDMVLVRFQWRSADTLIPDVNNGWTQVLKTPLATIAYGVYNINATMFVGGEGGPYDDYALIRLYDGTTYNVSSKVISHNGTNLPSVWPHPNPSELRYLELKNTSDIKEDKLQKVISFVDLNNNEAKPLIYPNFEENVPVWWLPIEELLYQLYTAFQGPCFNKLAQFKNADFMITPASVVPADAAGTTWLQGVLHATLVLFDIDLKGTEIFLGAAAPAPTSPLTISLNWRMPFLLLRINPVSKPIWLKDMRVNVFATPDKRYLLQMEPLDWPTTPWHDVHYLVVSVAGPGPNRVTWYFNDYARAIFPLTSPISKETYDSSGNLVDTKNVGYRIVLTPNGEILPAPSVETGFAVVAMAKDVFNNTALLVWGLRAADTYWAAYWVANNFNSLVNEMPLCDKSAIILSIDYGSGSIEWDVPDGGLPIGKPPMPGISIYRIVDMNDVITPP